MNKYIMNYTTICILGIAMLGINQCGAPSKPVDFKPGEHQCDYCKMNIVDMRFKAETITHKGKIKYFDSIECQSAWSHSHQETISSSWVTNFANQNQWIDAKKAFILQSAKLKSPMGAGLSAYDTRSQFNTFQKQYTGKLLTKDNMHKHILNWKENRHTKAMP